MNKDKQRIAIAEACGWSLDQMPHFDAFYLPNGHYAGGSTNDLEKAIENTGIPDYLSDMNAMHEACEAAFENSTAWEHFIEHLCDITGAVNCSMFDALIITNRATAEQRAEAFLRTIGKWEDEQ